MNQATLVLSSSKISPHGVQTLVVVVVDMTFAETDKADEVDAVMH